MSVSVASILKRELFAGQGWGWSEGGTNSLHIGSTDGVRVPINISSGSESKFAVSKASSCLQSICEGRALISSSMAAIFTDVRNHNKVSSYHGSYCLMIAVDGLIIIYVG